MYSETTRSIRVSVEPFYVSDQSEPDRARWVFGYRVRIENEGRETVQLLTRHWQITDGRSHEDPDICPAAPVSTGPRVDSSGPATRQ